MTENTDKTPRKKRTVHEHLEDLRTQTTASLARIQERERVAREKLATLVDARRAAEAELARIETALGTSREQWAHLPPDVAAPVSAEAE